MGCRQLLSLEVEDKSLTCIALLPYALLLVSNTVLMHLSFP